MQATTLGWRADEGWSAPFPEFDSDRTLILVFGCVTERTAVDQLCRAYPSSAVLGCSSAGEILGGRIEDDTLSVAIARFERTRLKVAEGSAIESGGSFRAGATLAQQLAEPDLRAVFVLSDGLSVNGTELLEGLHSVLGPDVSVSGGLAGDGSRFAKTSVLVHDLVRSDVVTAVGFYGDSLGVAHGSRGGWDVFGPQRVVTRSEGNVLYELDGQPALSLYKSYLGERAEGLPATALLFPLAVRGRSDQGTLVRTILSVDEASQSMTFAGDMPQESIVQLMRANFDRLIDGAADASRGAIVADAAEPLTIAVSCVGRRIVLGERAEEEIEAVLESCPEDAPLVGFYSYGEISPLFTGGCGVLHNQTMTITRYWET